MKILAKINLGLGLKKRLLESPSANAFRQIVNPGRLKLKDLDCFEQLRWDTEVIVPWLPCRPEDTNYNDLVAILLMCAKVKPTKILEIGTCRGRTTVALARNNDGKLITTYDIDPKAGDYIKQSPFTRAIDIRLIDFVADESRLVKEAPFDFIFIDAAHDYDTVLPQSLLCLKIVSQRGVILWHDYANTGGFSGANAVPEVLASLAADYSIQAIKGTQLAIYVGPGYSSATNA
jgi:predicted O-methyltransferase YrrM